MNTSPELQGNIPAKTAYFTEGFALITALMFCYSAFVKLYDWRGNRVAMYQQILPDWSKDALVIGLPIIELIVGVLLLVPSGRKWGFPMATFLMGIFSFYVAWVWLGLGGKTPCSCGGIISSLSWGQHLIFNLIFLGFSLGGWMSSRKKK